MWPCPYSGTVASAWSTVIALLLDNPFIIHNRCKSLPMAKHRLASRKTVTAPSALRKSPCLLSHSHGPADIKASPASRLCLIRAGGGLAVPSPVGHLEGIHDGSGSRILTLTD